MVAAVRAENGEASAQGAGTKAQGAEAKADDDRPAVESFGAVNDPQDPENALRRIRERGTQKDSLFPVSPLGKLRELTTRGKEALDKKIGLELGLAVHHLFQGLSNWLPGAEKWGTATDLDIIAKWKLFHRGKPTEGHVMLGLEGRWEYGGTVGPNDLGPSSLGSLTFTANTFSEYLPTFLPVRNLYWQQGSAKAGWFYRIGKITPDQILSTSAHLTPNTTFLSIAGTGGFVNALPDSGLGVAGGWSFNDRFAVVGVVSDANADRQTWGSPGNGDWYKGIDFAFKQYPRTPKAGYSKISLWHTDGTKDGKGINGMAGPDGFGFYIKLEQELTADGKAIGIARYGHAFKGAALYDQLASVAFIYYDPHVIGRIQNDAVGASFSWADPSQSGASGEYTVELFYRFPIFPHVDTSFNYQSIINPALTDEFSHASVFSLRITTSF